MHVVVLRRLGSDSQDSLRLQPNADRADLRISQVPRLLELYLVAGVRLNLLGFCVRIAGVVDEPAQVSDKRRVDNGLFRLEHVNGVKTVALVLGISDFRQQRSNHFARVFAEDLVRLDRLQNKHPESRAERPVVAHVQRVHRNAGRYGILLEPRDYKIRHLGHPLVAQDQPRLPPLLWWDVYIVLILVRVQRWQTLRVRRVSPLLLRGPQNRLLIFLVARLPVFEQVERRRE